MNLEWTEEERLRDALDWVTLSIHESANQLPHTPMPGHVAEVISASRTRIAERFRRGGMFDHLKITPWEGTK